MRNNARVWRSWRDVSCNVGLQHVSVIIHFHWKSFLGTRMCYMCCSMYVVIVPEEVWAKDKTRWKNKQKVTRARSLSLCCSLVSVKKKIKRELILYISGTWKKNFVHETRSKPSKFVTTLCAYVTLNAKPMGLRSQWHTPDKILS